MRICKPETASASGVRGHPSINSSINQLEDQSSDPRVLDADRCDPFCARFCPAVLAFLAAYVFKPSPLCWSSSIKYVKP
jgi:hypothetical protein